MELENTTGPGLWLYGTYVILCLQMTGALRPHWPGRLCWGKSVRLSASFKPHISLGVEREPGFMLWSFHVLWRN